MENEKNLVNCQTCGKPIAASAKVCPHCGAKNIKPKAPMDKKSKKKIKIALALVAAVVVLIICVAVFNSKVMPSIRYNSAVKNFDNRNYSQAIEGFSKSPDYKDSKQKLDESYFEYGKQLIEGGKFEDAAAALANTTNSEAEDYMNYANAVISLNENKFDDAISALSKLDKFPESKDYLNKAYYGKAEDEFKAKEYSLAKSYYNKTTGYKDIKTKLQNCDFMIAENAFNDGQLLEAKKLYQTFPKNFELNGVKVKDRLAFLNKHKEFVNLSGEWSGSNGKFSVRQTHDSTGLWDQWDNTYYDTMTVKCVPVKGGKFKIIADVKYYTYTNYSSISSGLKMLNMTANVNKTVSKIPSTLYSSGSTKVTYSNNKIQVSYDYKNDNYSMNFTYRYKSSITYKHK